MHCRPIFDLILVSYLYLWCESIWPGPILLFIKTQPYIYAVQQFLLSKQLSIDQWVILSHVLCDQIT